jgi:hypothetical protein
MSPTSEDSKDQPTDSSVDPPADPSADQPADQPAQSAQDDLRDKFRAALDRKQGKGAAGAGDDHASGTSKASARTSNSKTQREFRRKSGG